MDEGDDRVGDLAGRSVVGGDLEEPPVGVGPLGEQLRDPTTHVPAVTDTSTMLSKHLKRAGWSFVGPTTMYAFMQAMGLVNDHVAGCDAWPSAEQARRAVARSVGVDAVEAG